MTESHAAILTDRSIVRVAGTQARAFLHNLLTNDVENLNSGTIGYAALLTPQGKIIADILLHARQEEILLDLPREQAPEIVKRLTIYKLRAAVEIADLSESHQVLAGWGDVPAGAAQDPRAEGLGWRKIESRAENPNATFLEAWHTHRIALGIPHGGLDFAYNDAFPHEACMDQLHGLDFTKGCYIGQEVVSRMQHRGTARTRVIPVLLTGNAPIGTPITAGERAVGTLGSSAGDRAMALLRLDRAEEALAAGLPLIAGTTTLTPIKPAWARFPFPGEIP